MDSVSRLPRGRDVLPGKLSDVRHSMSLTQKGERLHETGVRRTTLTTRNTDTGGNRRKHFCLNSDTNVSNGTYLKERERRRKIQRKHKHRKMKKENKKRDSEVTLKWATPTSAVHRDPKIEFSQKENRHYCDRNCSMVFFWFWRLLGRL